MNSCFNVVSVFYYIDGIFIFNIRLERLHECQSLYTTPELIDLTLLQPEILI